MTRALGAARRASLGEAPRLGAILALLAFTACATAPVGPEARPSPFSARSPESALAAAAATEDPIRAAELAWAEANDRAYARARLEVALQAPGAARAPKTARAELLAALLDEHELRATSASTRLMSILERAPGTPEAQAALLLLEDSLEAHLSERRELIARLEGLLARPSVPAAQVTLASALLAALRELGRPGAPETDAALERGGWLRRFRALGPLAPADDSQLDVVWPAEESSRWTDPLPIFRGRPALLRDVPVEGRSLAVVTGELTGLYVLETFVELGPDVQDRPLALEVRLPGSGRVRVDGVEVLARRSTAERTSSILRAALRLAPGWHRITVALSAGGGATSLSLLARTGEAVVRRAETRPPAGAVLATAPPSIGSDTDDAGTIFGVLARESLDPDRALFARLLAASLSLTRWEDDPEEARALLFGAVEAAPRSALVQLAEARLAQGARMPAHVVQAALRQALRHDPRHPAALVGLARLLASDAPEQSLKLAREAAQLAPDAFEPRLVEFRVLARRGWNAEAFAKLQEVLARRAPARVLAEAADFCRSLDRHAEADALERQKDELEPPDPVEQAVEEAERTGALARAIQALTEGARGSRRALRLAHAAELSLLQGDPVAARRLAAQALEADPAQPRARLTQLLAAHATADVAGVTDAVAGLRAYGGDSIQAEAIAAALLGGAPGLPARGSWLEEVLAYDPWPLIRPAPGSSTPRSLDPADRWSRHQSVVLLDRVIDHVQPDGRSLSLRHSITRLQTKEATDQAGELELPDEALPLALRTLKPDGRTLDVDRHAGKDDLSFSALAPGDAVERQWVALDGAATPWGGFLRRFFFQGSSPTVRSDFVLVVPRTMKVWTHSYHGAPQPTIHEDGDRRIYWFSASDIAPLEPEPASSPFEEFVPFVVVAADLEPEVALRTNVLGLERSALSSATIRERTLALVRDLAEPEARARAIFEFLAREIGHGNRRDPTTVLTTKRGERTGLFTAMARAAGLEAELFLAQPGSGPLVAPSYPDPTRLSVRLVRVKLPDGKVLWARFDQKVPWLGQLPPGFRDGELAAANLAPRPPPRTHRIPDEALADWVFESEVNLDVVADGDARGTIAITLPGLFGAELREVFTSARREELSRRLQGWANTLIPGARLEGLKLENEDALLLPLKVIAEVSVERFLVAEQGHLVAEQFFNHPLVLHSLGLPTLESYLRTPSRKTPMLTQPLAERTTVTLKLPPGVGPPVEGPRSFRRTLPFGFFAQSFQLDPATGTATLVRDHVVPQLRITPEDFGVFREGAQEILQASRNRLILPFAPASAPGPKAAAPAEARSEAR